MASQTRCGPGIVSYSGVMKHLGTVPLETERLILRRFTPDDAEAMFRGWATDPEVTEFLSWPAHTSVDVTRHILAEWVAAYSKPGFYQWAIETKAGELIGSIGSVRQDDRTRMVHIGYCIGRPWWGQGYTTEALIRLIQFFFDDVGMNRIESRHDPSNPSSGKVMVKAGMRYEGTARQADWNNQGIRDTDYYAILAGDRNLP